MNRNSPILILLFFLGVTSFAQELDWKGKAGLTGLYSSEEINPFWMVANTNGQFGPASNFSILGEVSAKYALSETSNLEAGAAFFYRDELPDEFARRDLYIQFTNRWLKATAGAKKRETVVDGLSATNKNFLQSGNARPFTGLLLEASKAFKVSEVFSFDWGIAHYLLNDDRYVEDVRLHYKRLALITQFNEKNKLTIQIQHFVQWAGTSPTFGKLPSDFNAFAKVFTANKGDEINVDGELPNAVGNHLGSYLLDYEFDTSVGDFSLYHEHPFEDGSGTALQNFPDGVWGVHFEPKEKKIISGVLYEFITTMDQSASNGGRPDNYFRNAVYRSGWSYDGMVIGMPFILIDNSVIITDQNSPITSNREQVHHFGVKGSIKKWDWTLKSTLVTHNGSFVNPFNPELNLWHNYASIYYATESYGAFKVFGGIDSGELINTSVGAGLEYSYSF